MRKTPGACMGALLVVMALHGCAINPYVDNVRPDRRAAPGTPRSLEYSLQYADNLHRAYYAKHQEEFLRERNLSGGLLTLAAAGLLAGYGRAHRDVLVGLAVGGALAYQLGTWNTSRSRLDIYLEGMKAVSCAKAAIVPVNLEPGHLQRIQQRSLDTKDAMARAAAAAGALKRWLGTAQSAELRQLASAELAEYDRVVVHADAAVGRAAGLEGEVNQAGNLLELQLQKIEDSVTGAVNGTLADLRNLPLIIADTLPAADLLQPGTSALLAKGRAGGSATAEGTGGQRQRTGEQLPQAYESLSRETDTLLQRANELSKSLVTTDADKLRASLANCGVDPARIGGKLRVSPATVPLQPGAGPVTVQIFGGTPPYSVDPVGVLANGLTITRIPPASLTVAGTSTLKVGSFPITIRDGTNAEVAVTVDVQAATPPPPAPPTTEGTGGRTGVSVPGGNAPCYVPSGIARELTCFIQHRVEAKVDGDFGSQTCGQFHANPVTRPFGGRVNTEAVRALASAASLPAQPSVQDLRRYLAGNDLLQACKVPPPVAAVPTPPATASGRPGCVELAAGTRCRAAGARCASECNLSPDQLRAFSRRLNLDPPSTEFDGPLRNAVGRFQAGNALANTFGDLTEETVRKLDSLVR